MKATLLRRAAAWVAALVFLLPCVPALAGHDVVIPFPEELTIRMETESWTAADGRQAEADLPVTCQESAEQELRALLIHSNTCKTLYLTNLESGDVVGDKVEILAEYCSSGKSKRTVLEGIVGQALKLPEVVSAGWEVL